MTLGLTLPSPGNARVPSQIHPFAPDSGSIEPYLFPGAGSVGGKGSNLSEDHPSLGSSVSHLAPDGSKKYPVGTRVLLFGNSNDKKFMLGPEREMAERIGDEGKVIRWDGMKGRFLLCVMLCCISGVFHKRMQNVPLFFLFSVILM